MLIQVSAKRFIHTQAIKAIEEQATGLLVIFVDGSREVVSDLQAIEMLHNWMDVNCLLKRKS